MTAGRAVRFGKAPLISGLAALVALGAAALLMPQGWRETLRENGLDRVLVLDGLLRRADEVRPQPPVVIVDIDRRSLERLSAWPLPRAVIARLIEAIAAAKPRVIVIDVLFADADTRSPAGLARTLGEMTGHRDLAELAQTLPDGDRLMAAAMKQAPVVLGFVLDPLPTEAVPHVPILMRGRPSLAGIWEAPGATGPIKAVAEAAAGLGALALPGDSDGIVRRAPVFVSVGGELRPGVALEGVRAAGGGNAYLVQSEPARVRTADLELPLPRDALLRLVPTGSGGRAHRKVAAVDLLDGNLEPGMLSGAIVLVGSSAPEAGGLRQTVNDPLTPSVDIQADAVAQLLQGRVPLGVPAAAAIALIAALGLAAMALGSLLSPLAGVPLMIGLIGVAWAGSALLSVWFDRLLDPLGPTLGAVVVFGVSALSSYASTRRREARVRRRFEQHLAPEVVRRIVEQPHLLKLGGERRELTALFTDIESFTAMTHSADPARLVAMMDEYVEGLSAIMIKHGAMVDKVVGDAVHAFFNAPLDLDRHAAHAVACAVEIHDWTAAFRLRSPAADLGLGRTRIGIETGEAIVGDVGLHTKLDYTAYGDVVNTAARLEAANKELGSSICIGPVAASRLEASTLRPLGTIVVRGREDRLAAFEPWPADLGPELRARYLAAFGLIEAQPARAAERFDELARDHPADPVPAALARRLRADLGGVREPPA
jgi:adenylate cyclase